MQVRRGDFFARSLRKRFELGIKKAAIRGFFSSRVVRRGRVTSAATPFATTTSARVSR
jgi:hypothetical protein